MVWIFAFLSWTYIIPSTAIFHNTLYFEAKRQITETWCQRSTRYLKSLLHYHLVAVLLCLCHTKPYIILETLRRGAGLLQRNNKQSRDPRATPSVASRWEMCMSRWGGGHWITGFYIEITGSQRCCPLCFHQFSSKTSWANRDLRGWSRWGSSRTSLRTAPLRIYLGKADRKLMGG